MLSFCIVIGLSFDTLTDTINDLKQNYNFTKVLERADKQAEYIIRTMFVDIVKQAEGERDLKIEWLE